MEAFLFTLALIILLAGGGGLALLLKPARREFHLAEFVSLAILLGTGFVTLSTFIAGFVLAGWPLRIFVAFVSIGIALDACRRRRGDKWIQQSSVEPSLATALLIIELLIITWASLRLALGFDGIFIWESKARIIFGEGGATPAWLFHASPAQYPHPNYPLLLPLVESWFYGWMRSPNQGFAKLISPLFYTAITFQLLAAGARLGCNKWRAALPALLFFFLPWAALRTTSGEADIPLAACYTAVCIYLLEFVTDGDRRLLILSGVLAALLPWTKRDGTILWLVLLVLALLVCLGRRDLRGIRQFALPGLGWIIFWRIFLQIEHATFQPEYLPVSIQTLGTNLVRIPSIIRSVFNEMLDWRHWSILWLIPVAGLIEYAIRRQRLTLLWMAMVVAPIALYSSIYIFSAWQPFEEHITASLARLLLHVAPVTLLGIALIQDAPHEVGVAEPSREVA